MKKNDFFTACAPAQATEGLDLFAVLNELNGIKEAESTGDETVSRADEAPSGRGVSAGDEAESVVDEEEGAGDGTEGEKEVITRSDLYQYVWTWVHDTANFRWTYNPPSLATEADKILAIFRELYAAEPVHTLEIKKDCLRRAYWDVYRSDYISFSDLEIYLMMKALEFLMTATRFKKMMKAAGADIDEDEGAWLEGWNIASHFVLYGSEAVMKFRRSRKNNPLLFDDDVDEPFFETKRIKELIDCSNPHYMESLLAYPDYDVQKKERELNKRWLECRLI